MDIKQIDFVTDFKKIPVSILVGIILIVVFLLYNTNILTKLPCENTIPNIFAGTFTHVEMAHLLSNLFALYALSRVEEEMGSKSFRWLLIFLLVFNTLIEYVVRSIWDFKCSIGFSGILFGLITWEIVSNKNISIEVILSIIVIVIGPSMQNKQLSLEGHAIGAVSGIVGALLWKVIHNNR